MNALKNVPAAACPRCGGWTSFGGMSQFSNTLDVNHGRTGCICNGPKTYVLNWASDGYNTVQARNLAEARKKAAALANNVHLTLIPSSVHEAKPGEVAALDRSYASMFN